MAPVTRELFERGSAVGVLPYDPVTDQILLVEQFRIGALHEQTPWLLELIAGIIEPGESLEAVARREAEEEAGIVLGRVRPMQSYLSSPGGSSEKIHLFLAEADLAQAGGHHGLHDEGEDIRVVLMSPEALFARLDAGELNNAMTVIAAAWFRERYRNQTLWVS